VPADVDEHLEISLGSIAAMQTIVLGFVSLGDVTTREAIDWAFTYPKIVRGVAVISRIMNDIMSHEVHIYNTPSVPIYRLFDFLTPSLTASLIKIIVQNIIFFVVPCFINKNSS
jgi:hypothetical protein